MSPNRDQLAAEGRRYLVIARRYRPQRFDELIGQQHVATALVNAIRTDRVGHAYLFTGARGIGKTSAARILAKCLNCQAGPTPEPCNRCEVCQGIAVGEDVDVLEIDGASNRGIDEIRQLRSNVNIRPSRCRFKVYIIDEVHMLTVAAFNALLKTLEEPPQHVKFIFCTTDPEKIPITVLSRCQRYDFAPVPADSIVQRLQQIVQSEGVQADREALQLLARRAEGSVRDSQSLLEQLLAFCGDRITADDVHQMLGTAHGKRLAQLAQLLVERKTAAALNAIDEAAGEGVDPGQLAEQLLGYFRDMMAAAVGCDAQMMLHTGPEDYGQLVALGKAMGVETALAAAQILDEALTRMRQSTQVRTLLEMAIVRICKLEDLQQLSTLIAQLTETPGLESAAEQSGLSQTGDDLPIQGDTNGAKEGPKLPQKKSDELSDSAAAGQQSAVSLGEITEERAEQIWREAIAELGDMTGEYAGCYDRVAISAPNQLVVSFKAEYTHHKETCDRPERRARLEQTVSRLAGRPVGLRFELSPGQAVPRERPKPVPSRRQQMRQIARHPLVEEAIELFEAEVIDLKTPK